ncbi:hypothetical protein H0H81_001896 [Sphagnurus paluster]|uniref:Uncharacterized protein n=1 Tax=Sphagnurus paluster TaxID=117069 RepID=A0A9P7GNN8_9AGAR|nr:hypothetical protein H0H81_001896 [Sphagnurus paluster]
MPAKSPSSTSARVSAGQAKAGKTARTQTQTTTTTGTPTVSKTSGGASKSPKAPTVVPAATPKAPSGKVPKK